MRRRYDLYALIFLMLLGWTGNYVVGKIALREFPPVLLSGMRVCLAALLLLPVYWWDRRRTRDRWAWSEAPRLLLMGFLGVALNQMLWATGLSRTSAAHSAIFANMTPLVVLGLAAFVGLERITAAKVSGMVLAMVGVVVLKSFEVPHPGGGGPTWSGDLLTFCGCCSFALFTVLGKPVTKHHSSIAVNTFAFVSGALMVAPVTVWQASHFPFAQVSPRAWVCLFYMAAVSSVICYLIYYYALAHMAPSRIATTGYLQPPMTAMLGAFALAEPVTLSLILGMLVIFAGVALTERGR